jgi:glycosidase
MANITDYAINPQYGTLEDFKRLLAEAHRRMAVVIDLVLNHTSRTWFEAARTRPPNIGTGTSGHLICP